MASTDRDALVALYKATDGDNWNNNTNWNTDAPLGQWHGVEKFYYLGRVVKLNLSNNNLKGPIPEELGKLTALEKLNLNQNNLSGPIPPELGGLGKLETLWLHNNELAGHIPPQLGDLGALESLILSNNKLEGPIPKELGALRTLERLWLDSNKLTGAIPPELGDLRELQTLRLNHNLLTGPIPSELGNLSALKILSLFGNQLTRPIPKELGALRKLRTIELQGNQLSGPIPKELGALGELRVLKLDRNQLSGPIPPELGKLTALVNLQLWNNQLSGPVPDNVRGHPAFSEIVQELSVDGAPLPPVEDTFHAMKIVVLPVSLGYADLVSDIFTAVSYFRGDHPVWGGLGLAFALGPALITSVFFLSGFGLSRRVLVATHLSLIFEAISTVADEQYSPVLALVRVVEPLFESVPQLLLQLYAMLTLWTETSLSRGRLVWRVGSVCISVASLAYAATDVSSVECLAKQTGSDTAGRLCSFLTGWVFSRVPKNGNPSEMRGFGKVHPRSHVWFCLLYHVLEIVSRFVSLAMVFTVIRKWSLLVLLYLWMSRGVIVWASKTSLDFRFRVRLVAMPFMDSIVDGAVAFRRALVWTLLEFMLCLALYHAYAEDDLSASARRTLTIVVCSCMVGKMCLALVAIDPLKEVGQSSGRPGDKSVRDGPGESGASLPLEVEGPVRC